MSALIAVNPLGNVVITGVNFNNFPYPYTSRCGDLEPARLT